MLKSKNLSRPKRRDQQFLALIFKLYKHATVLTLTKLAYLTDYLTHEKTGKRLSRFTYRLYSFGPFDTSVYDALEKLIEKGVIRSCLNYTNTGLEYISYAFNDVIGDLKFKNEYLPDISLVEFHSIRDILYEFFYYDEKRLTRMIYHSKPIRALGITSPDDAGACGQMINFQKNCDLLEQSK